MSAPSFPIRLSRDVPVGEVQIVSLVDISYEQGYKDRQRGLSYCPYRCDRDAYQQGYEDADGDLEIQLNDEVHFIMQMRDKGIRYC